MLKTRWQHPSQLLLSHQMLHYLHLLTHLHSHLFLCLQLSLVPRFCSLPPHRPKMERSVQEIKRLYACRWRSSTPCSSFLGLWGTCLLCGSLFLCTKTATRCGCSSSTVPWPIWSSWHACHSECSTTLMETSGYWDRYSARWWGIYFT